LKFGKEHDGFSDPLPVYSTYFRQWTTPEGVPQAWRFFSPTLVGWLENPV
jgi:hypothetical protein